MAFLAWLQGLAVDADPMAEGFQAQAMYVVVCVLLPVAVGLFVGVGLRVLERTFGIEIGRGGGH